MVEKAKILICSCCGKGTVGRQWENADPGYGLCFKCGKNLHAQKEKDIRENYGIRGFHYDLNANIGEEDEDNQ